MKTEMEPLETLQMELMFKTDYLNIIVLDLGMSMHIATWYKAENKFIDFNTQKQISDPVMWCRLPNVNPGLFEKIVDNY